MCLIDHPAIVPSGYRIVARFYLLPIETSGADRRRRWVRVVQRLLPDCIGIYESVWVDVGYWDEVMLIKPSPYPE